MLASDEASAFAGYYGESDLVYLYSFHSLVVGKVTVLLVAVVKVDSTRVAFSIVATLEDVDGTVASTSIAIVKVGTALEVVRLVAGLVEAWEGRPLQAHPITRTAGCRMRISSVAAVARRVVLVWHADQ